MDLIDECGKVMRREFDTSVGVLPIGKFLMVNFQKNGVPGVTKVCVHERVNN